MSSSANDFNDRRRISKVTISPVSAEALVVRIQSMSADEKDDKIPTLSNVSRSVSRNPRENAIISKSTMSDSQKIASSSSQTTPGINTIYSKSTMTDSQKTASSSSQTSRKEEKESFPKSDNKLDSAPVPCLKHAAMNISRKAADIPSEKINLCNNCSKSMLSYIFVVQDFLDSLARDISGGEPSQCLQCARQELRDNLVSSNDINIGHEDMRSSKSITPIESNRNDIKSKDMSSNRSSSKRTSRAKSHQGPTKNEDQQHKGASVSTYPHQQSQQVDFLYNVSTSPGSDHRENIPVSGGQNVVIDQKSSDQQLQSVNQQNIYHQQQNSVADSHQGRVENQSHGFVHSPEPQCTQTAIDHHHQGKSEGQIQGSAYTSERPSSSNQHFEYTPQDSGESGSQAIFRSPMNRYQPDYDAVDQQSQHDHNNNYTVQDSPSFSRENVDGIVSTLSNAEREVYDAARDRAGWESLSEPQERLGYPPSNNVIPSEAFVTSCRNNAEAVGCLVVGTSLLLCRTTRTLCVLVSDGVSQAFRYFKYLNRFKKFLLQSFHLNVPKFYRKLNVFYSLYMIMKESIRNINI